MKIKDNHVATDSPRRPDDNILKELVDEGMLKLRLIGLNRKGKEVDVTLHVISLGDRLTNTVVSWTDRRPAAYSGYKIWRSTVHRFTTLLNDITLTEWVY